MAFLFDLTSPVTIRRVGIPDCNALGDTYYNYVLLKAYSLGYGWGQLRDKSFCDYGVHFVSGSTLPNGTARFSTEVAAFDWPSGANLSTLDPSKGYYFEIQNTDTGVRTYIGAGGRQFSLESEAQNNPIAFGSSPIGDICQRTVSCGNGVCESGESSSNCCMDCPSQSGGGSVAYGSWFCADSFNKARLVISTSYVCSNQTRAYEYVSMNSTETQACGASLVCSGGNCVLSPASQPPNATLKPDLVVDSMSFSPASPKVGENVTLTVVYKNIGTADVSSGYSTEIKHPSASSLLYNISRIYLKQGESATAVAILKYSSAGTFFITFIMDSGGSINELNETNNNLTKTIVVATSQLPLQGRIDNVFKYFSDRKAEGVTVNWEYIHSNIQSVIHDNGISDIATPLPNTDVINVGDIIELPLRTIYPNQLTNSTQSCTDSDGGRVYSLNGEVSLLHSDGQYYFYEDKCVVPSKDSSSGYYFSYNGVNYKEVGSCSGNDCYIGEAVCDRASASSSASSVFEASGCSAGCINGACAGQSSGCTDSDGGRDYYTSGTARGIYGGVNGFTSDYCSDGTNIAGLPVNLVEFYCNSSQTYTSDPYNCPYGCRDGACIAQPTNATLACTDSDGGGDFDYYKKGITSGPVDGVKHTGTDYCGGDVVFEYGCNPAPPYNFFTTTYKCPNGCSDGACILKTSCGNGFCEYGETASSCPQDCTLNFKIEDVSGPSSVSPGYSATFKVKAVGNDGLPARMEDGYRIRYYLYNCGASSCPSAKGTSNSPIVKEGYAGYNNPTSEWSLYLNALSAAGNYFADVGLFCYENKACKAEPDKAYNRRFYFTVGNPQPTQSLDFSLATDKSSYSVGEEVRISAKTYTAGSLVDAYVKGYVVRPDGTQDELVFAKESCKQPSCPPGAVCAQVICPVQAGVQNAVYMPAKDGAYYIKATASYGNSFAESSAKFSVGVQKKLSLYAWLEAYNYKPGDKVKILAKLIDSNGEPVLGASVYANPYWAGGVRPVYTELVGIETAASKKAGAASTAAVEASATAVMPTGYAVASIASSVEKQVSSDGGITYEENERINRVSTAQVVSSSSSVMVSSAQLKPADRVMLDYNPSSRYYEGVYVVPSGARSGTYKVAVSADFENQNLRESTSFTVGGEDYSSFESRAKQSASEGKYDDCKSYYLKAAGMVSGDSRRMLLDIEKAGICARLGGSSNVFYSDAARIVEKAAGAGDERYILLGVAAQYYELGGDYSRSRDLLEKAAIGLEGIQSGLGEDMAVLSKVVLAKYYSLLGKDARASDYYVEAAGLFAEKQGSGSDAFLANLFAARLYAKGGDSESAKKQYLLAADKLSGSKTGSSDSLVLAFMAGDSYEKAGEAERAREQYLKVVGTDFPNIYGSSDIFFAYSALGRSYERLGDKDNAEGIYRKGVETLLLKQDSDSSYFAAGLSGYLGDYAKAKELCRKTFEQSLSEESNIGKLTFMNAYCYSVLGDSVRAKKGCDLNSVTPQTDTMVLELILEPLPPPVSYCSQSTDSKPTSSCGNGVVDAGETSENCCVDTGCAFGDTCSKALNKCVKPVGEIPQETILDVLMKLEDARIKLDSLEGKALAISKYYGGKDQQRADAWNNAAKVFGDAKSKIDSIKQNLKDNKDKITETNLEYMRKGIDDVRGSLKKAIDAILEAV